MLGQTLHTSELLLAMGDYTPAIPEEVTAHFLAQSGFQATDERLVRLVSLATHKFVADLTNDALQHCKNRQAARKGDVRLVLTTEDLAQACRAKSKRNLAAQAALLRRHARGK